MSRKKALNDNQIEDELNLIFGIDDPEVSEDDLEPESENESENISDSDLMTIFSGIELNSVPHCSEEVEVSYREDEAVSPISHSPLSTAEAQESTPSLHSASRRRIIYSSSPEVPLDRHRNARTPSPEVTDPNTAPLYDTVPSNSSHAEQQSTSTADAQPSTSSYQEVASHLPTVSDRPVEMSDTDLSDIEENIWKKVLWPQNPDIESFDSVRIEPRQYVPSRTRPDGYFKLFFDEDVIDLIVTQTNIYAEQKRSRNWEPVDSAEVKAFIAMLILMGIHPLPAIDLYWSSDQFFRVDEIASVMTIKRFKKVLENMHLNDNAKMPRRGDNNYDKLFKVRPLLKFLNKACQNSAKNTTSQSIDESMIRFKGISSLKQFMPLKPIKRGYKAWVRADSKTGYVFEFDIYTGKRDDQTTEVGLGGNVVKSLTQKLVDEGFHGHVTFDNFFASYEIMQYLYDKGIYATATVNSNRSDLPHILKSNKKSKRITVPKAKKLHLERGDFKWRTKKNVAFVMWQDTKLVTILTTAFHPKMDKTFCDRKQKDGVKKAIPCPLTVLQ